ncbi:MAG TPA: hypothetical protein VHK88_05130 [Aquihabitans sp.]|jgi:hypothetical protein|nr:hypothetical protein [Aquihabitans sp.]
MADINSHLEPKRDARGYSWPPFRKNNLAGRRSGVHSLRIVDPLAAELAAALLVDRADLAAFPEALAAWARAEARCLLLAEHQAGEGLFDNDGSVRGGRYVAQFERLAADMRTRLGLDPRAEAELARSRAEAVAGLVDLDAVRERGREALERRRSEAGSVGVD